MGTAIMLYHGDEIRCLVATNVIRETWDFSWKDIHQITCQCRPCMQVKRHHTVYGGVLVRAWYLLSSGGSHSMVMTACPRNPGLGSSTAEVSSILRGAEGGPRRSKRRQSTRCIRLFVHSYLCGHRQWLEERTGRSHLC